MSNIVARYLLVINVLNGSFPGGFGHPRVAAVASPPTVSVLMPVYNGGRQLEPAVRSVLDQTFGDFELIVVDDGSDDGSGEVIARLAATDVRVHVLTHRRNAGLVASLNDGLELSRGELVARLDADDLALPTRLERQVALFQHDEGLVLSATAYRRVDFNGTLGRVGQPPATHAEFVGLMLIGNRLCHSTVMFRRGAVMSLGGYRPDWFPVEDYDLWLRLAKTGRYQAVSSVEVVYLDNPHGISSTRQAEQAAKLRARSTSEISDWGGNVHEDSPTVDRVTALAQTYLSLSRDLARRGIDASGLARSIRSAMFHELRGMSTLRRHATVLARAPRVMWDAARSGRRSSLL